MFVDSLGQLCEDQQITVDVVSENTIDLGNVTPKRRIGSGEPMCVVVAITAVGTTSGSLDIQIIESTAAALTSPVVVGLRRLVTADLAAGKVHVIDVPYDRTTLRYFGIQFDVTGVVDITVDAFLMPRSMVTIEAPTSYADAITIN